MAAILLSFGSLIAWMVCAFTTSSNGDPTQLIPDENSPHNETQDRQQPTYYDSPCYSLKVACAGDSLTLGEIGNPISYPDQLQEALGSNFTVRNFGVNSVTAIRGLTQSYNQTSAFEDSLLFDSDVFLLMLGTNDAKFWDQYGDERFEKDMEWIVQTVLEASFRPNTASRILLGIPPWIKQDYGAIKNEIMVSEVIPAIRSFAVKAELPLVDMYAITEGKDDYYISDNLHLNSIGYSAIMEAWKGAILCNSNGICEVGEDCQTCPQDLKQNICGTEESGSLWHAPQSDMFGGNRLYHQQSRNASEPVWQYCPTKKAYHD
eukprot:scaffold1062_cov130-Cylindrotheca_fusiformis.AAC.39